jgi:hypothetical protein
VRALLISIAVLTVAPAGAGEPICLRAVDARGRFFDLVEARGRPVAITFASRYTQNEAARVNAAFVGRDVFVVTVVDLVGVPSLFHGYARRKAAEHDGARVRHVVDGDGRLRRAFAADPARRVDILIVDGDGELSGRFVGAAQLDAALRLVGALAGERAIAPQRVAATRAPAATTRLRPSRLAW